MSLMTEPKIEDRKVQPYMGIRTRVPMQELDVVIPQCIGEVFALLGKQGVAPVHAPFVRYHIINMPEMLDIEVGIPAGRYASLIYPGIDHGIQANAALLDWGARNGLVWDRWETKDGDAFGSRFESFLTRPDEEQEGVADLIVLHTWSS